MTAIIAWVQSRPRWFLENFSLLLSIGILTFITFFPKIPLVDIIPGYIVRLRIEDLLLAGAVGLYLIQVLRKKASLKTPLTAIIVAYAIAGIFVMLNAIFVVDSLPHNMLHIGKMVLHYLRRLEYFSIFFLFYASIRTWRQVKMALFGVLILVVGISIYGYGQKYLYWPVYSTMNREFSKGMRLILTEHARVPSTFGGHYDMSAFVMFVLTLLLSCFFFSYRKMEKVGILVVFIMGFWLLILGSSRSSFLAYLLSTGVLILFIGLYKKSLWWALSRGFIVMVFSIGVMVTLGDLSSRFSQLGFVKQINTSLQTLLTPKTEKPKDAIAVDPVDKTDQLPVAVIVPTVSPPPVTATGSALPPDVYVNIPDLKAVTTTESGKTVTKIVEVPREFSDCSYKYGLSACIRLETLWPRAVNGFLKNPLLGSGYSTLTKSVREEFTEAESTDNDFLRTLGESGLIGAILFYGPIAIFFIAALKTVGTNPPPMIVAILFGIMAGSLGMLFNAVYIDVFAASKVAFMYWSVMGIGFAAIRVYDQRRTAVLSSALASAKGKSSKKKGVV